MGGFCWVFCSAGARHWRSFKDPGIEESICALKEEEREGGTEIGREGEREETKLELESNTLAYSDDSTEDCIDETSAQEDKRQIKGSAKGLSFIFTMQS